MNDIRIEMQELAAFELPPQHKVLSTGVGYDDSVLILHGPEATQHQETTQNQGGATFPVTRSADSHEPHLTVLSEGSQESIRLPSTALNFPMVQILPDGGVLVVGARCWFRDGVAEQNAELWYPDTGEKRTFVLGDGIGHLQVDALGQIWAGYFDEGVFGNFGWGVDTEPIGAPGICRFDNEGQVTWRLQDDSMADCYTLNVAPDGVWACYYTDFDIVHIDAKGRQRTWQAGCNGASLISAKGDSAVIWGGYDRPWTTGTLYALGEAKHAEKRAKIQIPVDGSEFSVVHNRGTRLFALSDRTWFHCDMGEAIQ